MTTEPRGLSFPKRAIVTAVDILADVLHLTVGVLDMSFTKWRKEES
jgi:hypothetical protein